MNRDLTQFSPEQTIQEQTLDRSAMERLDTDVSAKWLLEDCELEGDFSRLDLSGFVFRRCMLVEASWSAANLEDTQWLQCRAGLASFERAKLTDSRFEGCDLNNTRWRHAKLASAAFRGCKLTGANFEGVAALGLDFSESLLVGAALSGMSFRKQRLEELDFSDADLSGCDFREAVFAGGSLRNAHIPQANFGGADLRGADLGGLKMLDAKAFSKAVISQAQAAAILASFGLLVS